MRMNAGGKPQCCQPAREGERWLKLAEFSRKVAKRMAKSQKAATGIMSLSARKSPRAFSPADRRTL